METSEYVLEGELVIGGQEHWYLETQACVCVPQEDGGMKVFSSTQNPTETQFVVAEVLGLDAHKVECEVTRMGGAFGGKESQANHPAAWAALLANATGRTVKLVLHRDDDQKITGKRHRFYSTYKIGFNSDGLVNSYIVDLNADAGCATDLSMAILERAMFHAENAYYIPNICITATAWKTNLPSNTAYRGFGGPQGMAVIENAIDRVARFLKKDAADIRFKNFYGDGVRNEAPYSQIVKENRLLPIWDIIIKKSDYISRKEAIARFNSQSPLRKRGIALTPIKFGISFTTSFLNQAGALVLIYKDGSVLVNHGGTEMGQGLHTKIRRIAALELGISESSVKVNATNTSKVPNTSPTAASSGTDLNGMAVKNAIDRLKGSMSEAARKMLKEKFGMDAGEELQFIDNKVFDAAQPGKYITFAELAKRAHFEQISLSATGFYKTPGITFNKDTGKGTPFHYFAYGMAVSEVEVDTLTGKTTVLQVDIVHDVGDSINHDIDRGQVAGAFIQGQGWVTMEKMRYNAQGQLLNHSPDTYKIPNMGDLPPVFNIDLLHGYPNPTVIRKSKAVGEPPFMLAFSVWLAIKDAISAVDDHQKEPYFELPADAETVMRALKHLGD
jgi:xanthine dehydrogenase molybdopterin binding subunit